jgi:hypothetical protein
MKKIKLIVAAVAMMSLVSSSAVYADGFAPGEGLYVGAFGGMSTGIVQPKVETTDSVKLNSADGTSTTFEATEGGLALFGVQGGGWLGYGYKMGDLYIGFDMDYAGSGEEFELTSTAGVEVSDSDGATLVTTVKASRNWRGGGAARVGYYINADTLFTVKGGIHASEFDIDDGQSNTESVNAGGWQFGVGLESRLSVIDPNLSIRLEATYDDYLTAPISGIGSSGNGQGGTLQTGSAGTDTVSNNSEITGSGTNARIGLQYSFFDANTLF